jgi:hypothetical protein
LKQRRNCFGVSNVAESHSDVAEKSAPFGAGDRAAAKAAAEFLFD